MSCLASGIHMRGHITRDIADITTVINKLLMHDAYTEPHIHLSIADARILCFHDELNYNVVRYTVICDNHLQDMMLNIVAYCVYLIFAMYI